MKRKALARTYFMRKMSVFENKEIPEGKLAEACIKSAYVEWEKGKKLEVEEAENFLLGRWPTLKIWCDLAGTTPEYVTEVFKKCRSYVKGEEK